MQEDAQHKVDHQNKLARHEREPLDDQWSQAARATIEKELGELGREGDYRLMNVDCRSSSCLATVEWAGYGVAYVKWSAILAHSLPLPCRTAMYLEEPQDRTKPYQTTVVYECSRAL